MKINTGKGTISLVTLVAILSVSAIVSLPGLAISPILDDISRIFPNSRELEVSMLESLPSLMIIPFVLISGGWSVSRNNIKILTLGTVIFLLSGIWSLFSTHLIELIIASTIMGVGAGMIIPLSTGLIVQYFTGNERVRQLGVSSAVNNLTLVIATSVVGYLADVNWHLAFIVYLLPIVTLLLIPAISKTRPEPEPLGGAQNRQTNLNRSVIIRLMLFYFAITYLSLVVTFNTSYLASERGLSDEESGVIISLFFLSIMAPGFILDKIVGWFGEWLNFISLLAMGVGLVLMSLHHATTAMLWIGAILTGVGYGIMQPVVYDKAATNAPPRLSTLALSLVMAVNYLAILVAPFILDLTDDLLHATHHRLAYLINGVLTFVLAIVTLFRLHRSPVLGSDD